MGEAALDRFEKSLPTRPYATERFEAGLFAMRKEAALEQPYIQLHGVRRAYLPFDIDEPGAAFSFEEAGLPPFTITVVNPGNAHAHGLYELEFPVLFPDSYGEITARPKPVAFYRAVKEAYRQKLKADPGYVGMIVKNPLHGHWQTIIHDRLYTLEELAEYVDIRQIRPFEACNTDVALERVGPIPEGYRNDVVFNLARKLTYPRVKTCGSYEDLFGTTMNITTMLNMKCIPPLPEREVCQIVKSIARYCWHRRDVFNRNGRNRGACGFDPLPPVMEAQARQMEVNNRKVAGAAYAATIKRMKTEGKIKAALEDLRAKGKRPTKAAVAKMTGLNRDSVYLYRHLWEG
ncbi:MAG: replication initiation protein [Syntrophobacter sp.]